MALSKAEAARILALVPYSCDDPEWRPVVNEACRIAAEALRPEPKTGEWIEDEYGYCRCSECGWEWDTPEIATPYCPNCGAYMEEVLNDNAVSTAT